MRTLRLVALLVLTALVTPAQAAAHSGLSSRQNLPLPEVVFAWAAAAVLVVSFAALAVLWPSSRLEETSWRPLPWGLGKALGSRAVEIVCGTIGVALLVFMIVAGYVGEQEPASNIAPTFIMIIFWVGLVFVSVLFGDVFRAFNPWRAIGRATGAMLGRRAPAPRRYPEWLGRWPAALVLLIFTWIELVGHWETVPSTLVSAVLGYTVVTLAAQAIWGTETWTRRGEGFSVYFNFLSRISPFETRDRVVGLRPPLGGLPKLDHVPGTVAVVVVMIGTVTFDRCGTTRSRSTCRTRSRRSASTPSPPSGSRARSGCCSAWRWSRASTGSASRARARSAATSRPRVCGWASSTRSCRSRRSTCAPTT
jgi:hypothetical protein